MALHAFPQNYTEMPKKKKIKRKFLKIWKIIEVRKTYMSLIFRYSVTLCSGGYSSPCGIQVLNYLCQYCQCLPGGLTKSVISDQVVYNTIMLNISVTHDLISDYDNNF